MTASFSYELSAEYPHKLRNEWLLTLFAYIDDKLLVSVTVINRDLQKAIQIAIDVMSHVIDDYLDGRQLVLVSPDAHIRYGEAFVS